MLGLVFWATTRTGEVSTVHLLGWLFAYKFFQFLWWAGREPMAQAVLARKRACTPVLNSSCGSRALDPGSLMPSPWLHWAMLRSCLSKEKGSLAWPKASDTEATWADHGTPLWAAWQLWLTVCYGRIQSIWPQGSGDSCVTVMFPRWPKPVKSRLFNAPKVQVGLWAPEICTGILQLPQSTTGCSEQQEQQLMFS